MRGERKGKTESNNTKEERQRGKHRARKKLRERLERRDTEGET
jgi:hypothetical protein